MVPSSISSWSPLRSSHHGVWSSMARHQRQTALVPSNREAAPEKPKKEKERRCSTLASPTRRRSAVYRGRPGNKTDESSPFPGCRRPAPLSRLAEEINFLKAFVARSGTAKPPASNDSVQHPGSKRPRRHELTGHPSRRQRLSSTEVVKVSTHLHAARLSCFERTRDTARQVPTAAGKERRLQLAPSTFPRQRSKLSFAMMIPRGQFAALAGKSSTFTPPTIGKPGSVLMAHPRRLRAAKVLRVAVGDLGAGA